MAGVTVMEVTVGCTPVPDRLMVMEEFEALLVITTLPETLPAAAGANVTATLVLWPEANVIPDMPVALNPAPETTTLEIVALALPEFVSVALKELLLPVLTLPKLRLDELKVSCAEAVGWDVLVGGTEELMVDPTVSTAVPDWLAA